MNYLKSAPAQRDHHELQNAGHLPAVVRTGSRRVRTPASADERRDLGATGT